MKRLLLVAALAALVLSIFASAASAGTHHPPALHRGEHGQRVKNLQWILAGHKPSHHRNLKTYHGRIDGQFGAKTARGVKRMKYLLGYPTKEAERSIAGYYFVELVEGHGHRPIPWIARAAKRQAKIRHKATAATTCERHVLSYARSQIGVKEIPFGSNTGPWVSVYQSVTGAYGEPWCVSFVQWALWRAHIGPIANRTAGAVYLRDWAYSRGLLRSKPEPGTIAVWIYSEQHASLVESVHGSSYTTIDGNWDNQVMRVQHSLLSGPPVAFIYLPHCS